MKVFRDEIKLAFLGRPRMTKVGVQILMKRVSRHKGMWREIPKMIWMVKMMMTVRRSRILKGWGTLHLMMTLIMLHCKIFLIEYDAWASLESVTKTWIFVQACCNL